MRTERLHHNNARTPALFDGKSGRTFRVCFGTTDMGSAMSKRTENNMQDTFPNQDDLFRTDPDLASMYQRLVSKQPSGCSLDKRQRHLVPLVALVALHGTDALRRCTQSALEDGVRPVEIREAVYQCTPYVGFSMTEHALQYVNSVFKAHGLSLPLESQTTVCEENRFQNGLAVQKRIFGDVIDTMHASTPEDQKTLVVEHLSAFCFGDIYTRTGLDLRTRELLTFAVISALGGCDCQVRSHVQGNANVGNNKRQLVDVLELLLPLMGFPRTLNALACINAVMAE